jgi:translation initiation factor 1
MNKDKIVYSTDPDWRETCPVCHELIDACICESENRTKATSRIVYIGKEVKGRGGKTVTTISNVGVDAKKIRKELQRLCGAGGTIKNGIIEIQGDHRNIIRKHLEEKGMRVHLTVR